jgi:hypothetical protein
LFAFGFRLRDFSRREAVAPLDGPPADVDDGI